MRSMRVTMTATLLFWAACNGASMSPPDGDVTSGDMAMVGSPDQARPNADLAGVDLAGSGALSLGPGDADFGTVAVGVSSAPSLFTVTNTGSAATGPLAVSLAGSNPGDFSMGNDQCSGQALAPSASCTIELTMSPTGGGARSATLSVSGTPGGNTSATLHGQALSPAQLSVAPTGSQDFGTVVPGSASVEASFTITNNGATASGNLSVTLGGGDSADFVITSNPCDGAPLSPSGTCVVKVTYNPSAAKASAATLDISASPGGNINVALTGNGGAAAQLTLLSPASVDFGDVLSGTTSTAATVTVQNAGGTSSGALGTGLSGPDAARFAVTWSCGSGLAPGASCSLQVTFKPIAAGPCTATLTVAATPGGQVQIALQGNGLAPASLTVAPGSADFGSVAIGASSAAQPFTITNAGDTATSSAVTVALLDASQFHITSNLCGSVLAAHASCTVSVVFTPTAAAPMTTNLRATSGGLQQDAVLMGTGAQASSLSVSPSTFTFSSVVSDGSSHLNQAFTVTNAGGATSGSISTLVSDMTNFSILADGCVGKTLAPAATCTLTVRFQPAAGTSGTIPANLQVGESGKVVTAPVSGAAVAPAKLSLSSGALSFGNLHVGATSSTQTLTVTNTGDIDASALALAITGSDASQFIVSNGCGTTLAAHTSCQIQASFHPTTGGSKSATAVITSSNATTVTAALLGAGMWKLTVQLTGTGTGLVTSPGITCGLGSTACSTLVGNGTTAALTATPAASSTFVSFSGAGCGSTSPCTTTPISADVTVQAQFKIKTYQIVIDKGTSIAGATGTVSGGGISCGGICSWIFNYGTAVTLTATPTAGNTLKAWVWAGGPCDGSTSLTCQFVADDSLPTSPTVVHAVFTPFNKAFVTSSTYKGNFGGIAAADAACTSLANTAGLGGTGIVWKAWLSDSTTDAKSRFSASTRGWVRLDNVPVMDTLSGPMLAPIYMKENGATILTDDGVFTGTASSGIKSGNYCSNWTVNTTAKGDIGQLGATGTAWTALGTAGCNSLEHLYCLQDNYSAPVHLAVPAGGKRAFLSDQPFNASNSLAILDLDCEFAAAGASLPNAANYIAFLATDGATAASRLASFSGSWYRVDGVPLFNQTMLNGGFVPNTTLNVGPDGTYYDSANVWTGAANTNLAGTSPCGNWKPSSGSTLIGSAQDAEKFFSNGSGAFCNRTDIRVYCIEN